MRTLLGTALLLLLSAACSGSSDGDGPILAAEPAVVGAEPAPPEDAPSPAPAPPAAACEPLSPRTKPLAIAVQPEALAQPFVAAIEEAKSTVRVMVYQMGFGPVLDALLAKASAGVKVRVILDVVQKDVNQKYMDRLTAAGAEVIWSDPAFSYMHAKVIVVDDAEAVISTGNYYIGNMQKERNYAVTDSDPADVEVLAEIFDADFDGRSPDLSCTRLLVSPVNARQRMLDFIASAKSELLVHSMQLADRDVRDALVLRKKAGVKVRALLADPGWIDANAGAAAFLAESGIEARWAPHVHVKAIVADGATAYVGSINLSYTSLTKNREVGLLVTEPDNVGVVRGTFEKDWATATAF